MTQIPDQAVQAAINAIQTATIAAVPDCISDEELAVASLTAAAPYLTASVEVGELEWKTNRADKMNGIDTERTGFHEFGYYSITGKSGCYYVSTFDNMGRIRHIGHGGFGNVIEAKAAAQADYNKRILSAIKSKPVDLTVMAKSMLSIWDQWMNVEIIDRALETQATDLLKAALYAGVAYDDAMSAPLSADNAPAALLRVFLIALVDWKSPELDPYRAKNRPQADTPANASTQPVDAVAVREAEAVIERNGEEVTAAAMINIIAEFLRKKGKAVLTADNSFGKHVLEFKLAADSIRALSSAEPVERCDHITDVGKMVEALQETRIDLVILRGSVAEAAKTNYLWEGMSDRVKTWIDRIDAALPPAPTSKGGE